MSHVSLFEQQWWYDAATNGDWQLAGYTDGNTLRARLVYVRYRRKGVTTIGMPVLARVTQPVIALIGNPPKDGLSLQIKALRGLTGCLPRHDQISYSLPPESDLELAYCLAGYTVTASYTFRSDPDGRHDPWTEMDRKVRHNIKTGLRRLAVEVHDDVVRYLRLSNRFISGRAFAAAHDDEMVWRVWKACYARGQASALSCVDASGQDLASVILLWDDRHLYYWLNCRNPDCHDNTANSVLVWHAIQLAARARLVFDMDGYASTSAGIFKSRFGLIPHRRFDVSMIGSGARLRTALSSHFAEVVGPRFKRRLLSARNVVFPTAAPATVARDARSGGRDVPREADE